eukprot:13963053-Ditylum_brightwellii.AAC.1
MDELESCNKIFITSDPAVWSLHSEHYSKNKNEMLDVYESLIVPEHCENLLIDEMGIDDRYDSAYE